MNENPFEPNPHLRSKEEWRCVDLRGVVNPSLGVAACGTLCATVNFGEAAWVSCDLLFFADGKRLVGPKEHDLAVARFDDSGWSRLYWTVDENFE